MSVTFNKKCKTVESKSPLSIAKFRKSLLKELSLRDISKIYKDIILVCIGTDRSTGDCLGPLVGHKLSNLLKRYTNIHVMGTLDDPVHAKNLKEIIEIINNNYNNPFIIAIDACLGKAERVGYVSIGEGPLKPGAGVNKKLPPVGNIHITGVVNICGFMEYVVLQNTRLNTVMKMANVISNSLNYSIWKIFKDESMENKASFTKKEFKTTIDS